jgi:DNA-binding SARP family transcriptional activator
LRPAGILFSDRESVQYSNSVLLLEHGSAFLSDPFLLSFDIDIQDPEKYGEIVEIRDSSVFAALLVYNAAYHPDTAEFRLTITPHQKSIRHTIAKHALRRTAWHTVAIFCDTDRKLLSLRSDTSEVTIGPVGYPSVVDPRIEFGPHEDPVMAIRDVRLIDVEQERSKLIDHWPLFEDAGDVVHDIVGGNHGTQTGLTWLMPKHYEIYRDSMYTFSVSASWNPYDRTFHIFAEDKHGIYAREAGTTLWTDGSFPWTGRLEFDPFFGRMIMMESSIGKLTFLNRERSSWDPPLRYVDPDSLQHGSAMIAVNHLNGEILRLGGYGWFTFKNDLARYNEQTRSWEPVEITGDRMEPRQAMGYAYASDPSSVYLFGGQGNESGDQADGYGMFFDLWKLDLATYTMKLIWKKPVDFGAGFGFGFLHRQQSDSTMIYGVTLVDSTRRILLFEGKHESDDLRRVYEISDPDIAIAGFDEVRQEMLFYHFSQTANETDPYGNGLFALRYPPMIEAEYRDLHQAAQPDEDGYVLFLVLGGLFLIAGSTYGIASWKIRKGVRFSPQSISRMAQGKTSCIHLFGGFRVFNRFGEDITPQFSPKIRQILLLTLLTRNGEEGITTERLTTDVWPDASPASAKNARGVTIARLRSLLSGMSGISLVYEAKHWKIVFEDESQCELKVVSNILDTTAPTKAEMRELIRIASAGEFLPDEHFEGIDVIRRSIEEKIIHVLMEELLSPDRHDDLQHLLACADTILVHDAYNERAFETKINLLVKAGRKGEAQQAQKLFERRYKNMFGVEYTRSSQ